MSLFPSAASAQKEPQSQSSQRDGQPAWASVGSSYAGHAVALYAPQQQPRVEEDERKSGKEAKDKKRKKEKHSKKVKKQKKQKKVSREHKLLEDGAAREVQPYLLEYRSGSSDFDSSSDDEQLAMIHVPSNKEMVYMPNGQVVLADLPQEKQQFVVDKRGDRNTLTFEGFYRKDIPDYVLQALPTHGRASKAVSLRRILTLTNTLHSVQDQPSIPFSKRYFGGQAVSGNTSVNVRRWRIPELKELKAARALARSRAQPSGNRNDGGGSIFRIEEEEEKEILDTRLVAYKGPAVEAGSVIPLDPKGLYDDSSMHHKAFKTDAETAQNLAVQLTKDFNERTREHPEDLDAWLELARSQDKITRLQRGTVGALSAWSRVVVEKAIAVMESAKKHHPDSPNLYLHWIRLALAYQSHEQVQGLWHYASQSCPMSVELRYFKPCVQRMHFPSFAVATTRTAYATDIWAIGRSLTVQRLGRPSGSLEQRQHEDAEAEYLMIDMLHGLLIAEQAAGHRERAVALIQAFLELNLNRPTSLISETTWETLYRRFSEFWESDTVRLGDLGVAETTQTGWKNWFDAGKPSDSNLEQTQSTAASRILHASGFFEHPVDQDDHNAEQDSHVEPPSIDEVAEEVTATPMVINPEPAVQEGESMQSLETSNLPRGRKRRMKAADYFKDIIEPEHEKALKRQGLDVTEDELAAKEGDGAEVTAVADDGTVYSVVHGYRIKVADSDTSLPYRKMLAELREEKGYNGDDIVHMSVEDILALSKKEQAPEQTAVIAPDDRHIQWAAAESIVSRLQWNVVSTTADEQAADEQPERVVLFDDIKAVIFPVHTGSGIARLMLRLLQSLGVQFGLVAPAFEAVSRMQPQNCDDISSTLLARQVGSAFDAVLGIKHDNRTDQKCDDDGLRALSRADMIAVATSQVLERHRESQQLGMFSVLHFVVQCLATVVTNSSNRLTLQLRCQWAAACMILTAQARTELTADLRIVRPEAADDASVRSSCRALLSTCEGILADQGQACPAGVLLELRTALYGAYIQAECVLSAPKEAYKICDKTIQTLQSAGSLGPIGGLCWLALRLILQLPIGCAPTTETANMGVGSGEMASQQLISNMDACVQNAFSMLQSCKAGRYVPVLSKKRKTPDLSLDDMSGILDDFTVDTSAEVHKFLTQTTNTINHSLPSNVTDCSALDATPSCTYLVALLAWLSYLLEVTRLRAQRVPPLQFETALSAADQVFERFISEFEGQLPGGATNAKATLGLDAPHLSSQSHLMFGKPDGVDIAVHQAPLSAAQLQCIFAIQRLCRWRVEMHTSHWKAFGGSVLHLRRMLRDVVSRFPADPGFLSLFLLVETQCPGGAIGFRSMFNTLKSRLAWGGGLCAMERVVLLAHECLRIRLQLDHEHENIADLEAATALESRSLGRHFEKLLEDPVARGMPVIWRSYLRYEVKQRRYEDAKRLFYRAIQSCSWCKELWLDAFRREVLRPAFSVTELADIRDIMDEKGLYIRIERIDDLET